jgi:HEAT repeat protein
VRQADCRTPLKHLSASFSGSNFMGHFTSYALGIFVAALVIFGLYCGVHFSSSAMALQIGDQNASEVSVAELGKILSQPEGPDSMAALITLTKGKDEMNERIKALCSVIGSNSLSYHSIASLTILDLKDEAKPVLREMFATKDPQTVSLACAGVHALGTEADELFDDVVSVMRNSTQGEDYNALYALQKLSPELTVKVVDEVQEYLKSDDFNMQCNACRVLKNMGRGARPALDDLIQLFNEGNPSTRSRAAYAIAAIGPVDGYDIPKLLVDRLNAPSQIERARLLGAIGMLGPDASEHADTIAALMSDARQRTIPEAALAYYKITGDETAALKPLLNIVANLSYQTTAIECIGAMGQGGADAVEALIPLLSKSEEGIVETTILALGNIGPAAEAALPKLNALTKSSDFLIAKAAEESIKAISSPAE